MRIWVTRSEPGASRQAAALQAAGYQVLTAPVLQIEATGNPAPQGSYQQVIFLSEHAVGNAGALDFCAGARVHAIGRQTAAALQASGIAARSPDHSSSDGLLEQLAGERLAGQSCLIVAGEGGRKTLARVLAERGARVQEYLCYRRVAAAVRPDALVGITHILVASQDGFRAVARLWCSSGRSADVKVIVASDRIAELGSELGLENVQSADGAADEDWITALENRNA